MRRDPRLLWVLAGAGGLAVVAAVLLGLGMGRFSAGAGGISFAGGGLTVESLDCGVPTFQAGKAVSGNCLATATITGGTDSVVGGFSATQTGQYPATYDVQIQATGIKQTAKFSIQSSPTPAFSIVGQIEWGRTGNAPGTNIFHKSIDLKTGAVSSASTDIGTGCPSAVQWDYKAIVYNAQNYFLGVGSTDQTWICLRLQPVGAYGDFKSLGGRDVATFSVSKSLLGAVSQTDTATLDTDLGTSVALPLSGGRITWLGDSSNLAPPIDVSGAQGFFVQAEGKWHVIDRNAYGSSVYGNRLATLQAFGQDMSGAAGSCGWADPSSPNAVDPCRQKVLFYSAPPGNVLDSIASGAADKSLGSFTPTSNLVSKDSGAFEVVTSQLLSYMRVRFELPAAWLGLFQSSGIPKISGVACDLQAGRVGNNCVVSLQNTGPGAGQFAVSVSCGTYTMGGSAGSNQINLGPGASGTVSVPVNVGLGTGASSDSCSATATDQLSFAKDVFNFAANSKAAAVCTEGATRVAGLTVYVCKNGAESAVMSCTTGGAPVFVSGDPSLAASYTCTNAIAAGTPVPGLGVAVATPPPSIVVPRAQLNWTLIIIAVAVIAGVVTVAGLAFRRRGPPPMEAM